MCKKTKPCRTAFHNDTDKWVCMNPACLKEHTELKQAAKQALLERMARARAVPRCRARAARGSSHPPWGSESGAAA